MHIVALIVIIFNYSGSTSVAAIKTDSLEACQAAAADVRATIEASPAVQSTSAFCIPARARDKA